MKSTTITNQMITGSQEYYTTGFVTSKDGTTIGYRQLGQGPGIVLVQGTMGTSQHFMQLASTLADTFTVFVPDRRGRGLSGLGGSDYNMRKEVEDLDALLMKTDAHFVFGLSSGALISLQAAITLPTIHKLAIFEPPLFINGSAPTALIARYEKEISEGKVAAALLTGMKAGQFGPPIFNALPRWLMEWLVSMAIRKEEKQGSDGYPPMRELAFTLHNDFQLVNEMSDKLESFKSVRIEVLLLGGSKSPSYLTSALDHLEKTLPHAKRTEFPGLGHAAAWNTDRGGQPEPVARELRRFFTETENSKM
jgi:pimeloyl-ACP methyl ester carboxylesterase